MFIRIVSCGQLCAVILIFVNVFTLASLIVENDKQASLGRNRTAFCRLRLLADGFLGQHEPVYEPNNRDILHLLHSSPLPDTTSIEHASSTVSAPSTSITPSSSDSPSPHQPVFSATSTIIFHALHDALSTLQTNYFALWLGKYTTAIDWTAAVTSTHLSATLSTLSRSIPYTVPGTFNVSRSLDVEAQMVENEINKYFAQTTAYYFGEDYVALRMEAYDDMLWVVLGWLESLKTINGHDRAHYDEDGQGWHAKQWIPVFAHRARVFYELAAEGWDWRLCGGGMTWNPHVLPYKNAITNQLFISASISMYLHFPGDTNCSPFFSQHNANSFNAKQDQCDEATKGDPAYLASALHGYTWLRNSGMLNAQGLYTDGFHIRDYRQNHSKTVCDERNEMVYTYNQGVILSGLRDLWLATADTTFLSDGHELVGNVMRATGWPLKGNNDDDKWHGIGTRGILTEACDPRGSCSQNGQTFKGIFFHHLTAFCRPLPLRTKWHGLMSREVVALHERSCKEYTQWVVHNACAALSTRDEEGRFGGWWGAQVDTQTEFGGMTKRQEKKRGDWREEQLPDGAVDYRNLPLPPSFLDVEDAGVDAGHLHTRRMATNDPNNRGRARTVETHGSGLAVVRAAWEFIHLDDPQANMDEELFV